MASYLGLTSWKGGEGRPSTDARVRGNPVRIHELGWRPTWDSQVEGGGGKGRPSRDARVRGHPVRIHELGWRPTWDSQFGGKGASIKRRTS